MGNLFSIDVLLPALKAILRIYDIVPFSNFWTYRFVPTGLIKLIVHRAVMGKENLYKAPFKDDERIKDWDGKPSKTRPADGFGTDINNPSTAINGGTIGRNMPAIPKHLRDPHGAPDVQMVAQRLLAREEFKPAASQLNILAAAWIQAMVHDWINHLDSDRKVTLDRGAGLCPMAKFNFKATEEREDGHFESARTQWWDASFLYGNNDDELERARTKSGGKMKTNQVDHILPEDKTGLYTTGDNQNSWVGVTVLQELFVKEHNYIADQMSKANPEMTDEDLFNASRLVIAALVAKIHTVDWTVELLKTNMLQVGMWTNWYGIPKAIVGTYFPSLRDFVPTSLLSLIGKKSDNRGVPYCLTEEFAAVYRLHSLSPPGLVVGEGKNTEFIPLLDLFTEKGNQAFHKTPTRPTEIMKSVLSYPCGHLVPSNYPVAYRNMTPTDEAGNNLPEDRKIDLAALDLFRDRERGIRKFNEFRRELSLKPYDSWMELTGGKKAESRKLELIYGPGKEGVERCDLLVGDMYEKKPTPSFALSETSFVIFLVMASRRLEADPYLNEYYNEEYYTQFGLDHIKSVDGLFDILKRHYPELAKDFEKSNGKAKQSVFKPTLAPTDWEIAVDKYVDEETKKEWKRTKESNEKFFNEVEKEARDFQKSKNV
mmetsp:Transcript_16168/g.34943  ORF Transcript_16168/g.34943 Transcript_16168/m.34943 type:complete len:655 (+) Transcript_16168:228-2192(+)|eukprot:CAMPEP_0172326078 /NCGR_PEP_ID=MMETSP1058-20130122/55534_1 /TAXON_ID=83371 /ORGANISM="Detonula confervacea, Strain CCMP 353" /LENGTH=654 /DNA_ID=CAMNT_0013042781 /DNA_START=200 /DNA_END=2164 /DNA_ORIENTATION=+